MKWYNFETLSSDLKDALRAFLKSYRIKYELSAAGAGWHFEIYGGRDILNMINSWLDNYYASI